MSAAILFLTAMTLLAMMTSQTMSAPLNGEDKPDSELQPTQLQEAAMGGMGHGRLLKRSLREELERHFDLLQQAEEDLLQRIEALKAQRQAVNQRKRSHYMCMVNIVACYK